MLDLPSHGVKSAHWTGIRSSGVTHHEEGAEVHTSQQAVLHLGDLQEDPQQLSLLLQTREKQRGGALPGGEAGMLIGRGGAVERTSERSLEM